MKRNAFSGLLWITVLLLLCSGGNCSLCPKVKEDVNLFITGTKESYAQQVAMYVNNPLIIDNAKNLKQCIDNKLTEEDKKCILSALDKIEKSLLC